MSYLACFPTQCAYFFKRKHTVSGKKNLVCLFTMCTKIYADLKKLQKKVFLNYDVVVIKNETKSMRIKKRKEEKKSVKYKH